MVRSYFTLNSVHELLWQCLLRPKSCFKEYLLESQVLANSKKDPYHQEGMQKAAFPFSSPVSEFLEKSDRTWFCQNQEFDSQGGCQLHVAKCWRRGEEPRMWLWSLSALRLAASDKCGKWTKAETFWPSKSTHFELPSLYCQVQWPRANALPREVPS